MQLVSLVARHAVELARRSCPVGSRVTATDQPVPFQCLASVLLYEPLTRVPTATQMRGVGARHAVQCRGSRGGRGTRRRSSRDRDAREEQSIARQECGSRRVRARVTSHALGFRHDPPVGEDPTSVGTQGEVSAQRGGKRLHDPLLLGVGERREHRQREQSGVRALRLGQVRRLRCRTARTTGDGRSARSAPAPRRPPRASRRTPRGGAGRAPGTGGTRDAIRRLRSERARRRGRSSNSWYCPASSLRRLTNRSSFVSCEAPSAHCRSEMRAFGASSEIS